MGSSTHTTQTQTNSLQGWIENDYQKLASQAIGQSTGPNGQPNQIPATHGFADTNSNLSNYFANSGSAANAGTNLSASNAYNGYTPNAQASQVSNGMWGSYQPNVGTQQTATGNWNNDAASQYMNPYTTQVLQAQHALANQQFGQENAQEQRGAAASGALGGDRNAINQAMLNQNHDLQLQNMDANALNSAYTNAQQAFNADQGRNLQSQTVNAQNNLAASSLNNNLGFAALNAQNQNNLANANLGTQANLLNSQLGYGALGATNSLNTAATAYGLQGLNQSGQAAEQQQQFGQAKLDNDYTNAMNSYLFPEQQLQWQAGILNSVPNQEVNQMDQTTTTNPGAMGIISGIASLASGIGSMGMGMGASGLQLFGTGTPK